MNYLLEFQRLREGMEEIKKLLDSPASNQKLHAYDNSDVIRMLNVSRRTLATWRAEGKISFSQVGSKLYYSQQDLDDFLANHKVKAFNRKGGSHV